MLAPHARERIRRLRLSMGISQADFGDHLGISPSTVSKIENARIDVTADQLHDIAALLDCTPEFLNRDVDVLTATKPWLRAYADASKKAVDRQIADSVTAVETIEILGLRTLPDTIPIFDGDLADDDAIESMATAVRVAAGIDEDAVCVNSIRAAERLGCLVLPMGEELGRHLGMSMRADGIPVICASRPSLDEDRHVPGDRQRFTVAHELGHLALHSTIPAPHTAAEASRIERQAHQFAGAFLAPADAMLEELRERGGKVTLKTLADIKESWGIAIKALVMRFQVLGVIDPDQARSLHKQISARGWSKQEPIETGNEAAVWMSKVLSKGAVAGQDPLAHASDAAGIGVNHLRRWTDWSPTASGTVTHLPDQRTPDGMSDGLAPVTKLSSGRRRSAARRAGR